MHAHKNKVDLNRLLAKQQQASESAERVKSKAVARDQAAMVKEAGNDKPQNRKD